jgi:hypothetical protein
VTLGLLLFVLVLVLVLALALLVLVAVALALAGLIFAKLRPATVGNAALGSTGQ